ncbi:MAG: TonB-dependent receptor [Alphaproteobacteria bacterium]|nr:TonB-dependent receptor [Alphaproteobacteria bacterium]
MKPMHNRAIYLSATASVAIAAAGLSAQAQDTEQQSSNEVAFEEVVVVGSRSLKPRSSTDSPVPVDAFSGNQLNSLGNSADVTDNLKALVPSYTATPATGDGSAFVRPTSLRGMSPDQTLILVNGKRRHRSALVQFFAPAAGNGSHGVDVGMIPSIALKRVEVLRDGAAAQYGSDAIAGVINFVVDDAREGGKVVAQYGQFYEGEQSWKVGANAGLPLGETGFLNISAEYSDNDALSRGIQRPDAQALVDAGVSGVGADSPFGDEPFVQTWGRPETSGARLFVNSGIEVADATELYLRASYADTDGRYRFFYRGPTHGTITALLPEGLTGSITETGYTPYLDGAQKDYSVIAGINGETDGGWRYDVSGSLGKNELSYFLNNSINTSLGVNASGAPTQMDFDMGGYEQKEVNINADISYAVSENLNLAFGGEWREETFTTIAGETAATTGVGPSGMTAVSNADAGSFSRDNWAIYADVEHDISDAFMLQYALRYEDFSDFGGTLNGKIAGRYTVNDNFTIRGGISTGFHAPTPGQANISTIITTFDGVTGLQVEEGLIPATSPDAVSVGGQELKEEKSMNYSLGFASSFGEASTLTVDFYRIEVDDRIYRTSDIQLDDGRTISFYTNAIDTRSQGVDVVLSTGFDWSAETTTDFALAANYNDFKVTGQRTVNGVQPVGDATVEDIESNYPKLRFVATANTHFGDAWNVLVRANFYGKHWDERGTQDDAVQPSKLVGETVFFDFEVGYQVNDNLRVVGGLSNAFDSYPDRIGDEYANRLSVGLPYPRRSAANYEGGSWYLRASYQF